MSARIGNAWKRCSGKWSAIRNASCRCGTCWGELDLHRYLEGIVARAYGEIHAGTQQQRKLHVGRWFTQTFPSTFRRRIAPFWLSVAVTIAGCIFGAAAMKFDSEAKRTIMPFQALHESP